MNNTKHLNLRYSLLALLSSGQVSLFNESLIRLAERLLTEEMSRNEDEAELSAYILDSLQEFLAPDTDPYLDLERLFVNSRTRRELMIEYKKKKSLTLMPTYKVSVTPTLQIFEPAIYEEGNYMMRQHKDFIFHFMRVALRTESKEQMYFNYYSEKLLCFVSELLSNGIKLGNRKLSLMAYSNAQLKQKAFWFLCENEPILMSTHTGGAVSMVEKMGTFNK